MASATYDRAQEGCEVDKLTSLKAQLKQHTDAVVRLEAAVKFLEENPGAQALINSI